MGLSLSLLMLLISWSCDKASRRGPIEASLTRFFMSEPEYPANARIDAKPLTLSVGAISFKKAIMLVLTLAGYYYFWSFEAKEAQTCKCCNNDNSFIMASFRDISVPPSQSWDDNLQKWLPSVVLQMESISSSVRDNSPSLCKRLRIIHALAAVKQQETKFINISTWLQT